MVMGISVLLVQCCSEEDEMFHGREVMLSAQRFGYTNAIKILKM